MLIGLLTKVKGRTLGVVANGHCIHIFDLLEQKPGTLPL